MTVDGVIVVDRWDTCCDDISFGMNLTLDAFYDVVIEYKEHEESAHFKLEWVSLNVPREVVHRHAFTTLRESEDKSSSFKSILDLQFHQPVQLMVS